MDDRLALRQAPAHPDNGNSGGPNAMHDPEENEDEKVYYGFGVFMGLPLADLKAMKEDYLQKQAQALANGGGNDFRAALPSSAGAARSVSVDYDAPRVSAPGGRVAPSDYSNGRGGDGGGGVVPPLAPLNGRGGHPIAPRPGQAHYGASMGASRALGRAYDASHDDDDEALSDEGSDGSYSAPKSHSLNFILH